MNCKHIQVKGNRTKYFFCNIKDKSISENECKKCMLKIPNLPKGFEEVFGKGFMK